MMAIEKLYFIKTRYKVNMQNGLYFYILAIENEVKVVSSTMVSKTYNIHKS